MTFWQWILSLLGYGTTTTTTTKAMEPTTTTTTPVPVVQPSTTTTTTPSGGKKMKIALCVGINKYPNPANNLAGCVNDAHDMAGLLKTVYGFDEVVTLLDSEATYANVTRTMISMLSRSPDVFAYTNSSHGTRGADIMKTEEDGYAEAICLYDQFLWDYDFKTILSKADPKTDIIIFSDSCHSCGVTREFLMAMNDSSYVSMPRYLPPADSMEALHVSMMPLARAIFEPRENMKEVLLAGCQSSQFSYDANFGGKPNGAFTYYTLQVLKENPYITYGEFVNKVNRYLPSTRYPQNPVCETNVAMKLKQIFG